MALTAQCHVCHHIYKVDEKLVGKKVKCTHCGTAFLIEAPPPPDIDPFAEGEFDAVPEQKPVEKQARLYNPIESNSISSPVAKPAVPAPVAAPFTGFARTSGSKIPVDKLTWASLAGFILLSLGVGGFLTNQLFSQVKDGHVATVASAKIWGWIVLFDLLLFLVVAPLLLAGVFAATKILHFRLGRQPYLHAAAVVAVGALMATLAQFSPDLLKIALLFLMLPAMYYVLKIFFDIDWSESGLAIAFGAGGMLLGGLILKFVLGLIMPGTVFSAVSTARELALAAAASTPKDESVADSTKTADSSAPLPESKDPALYAAFKDLVQAKTTPDISQSTREEHLADLNELKRQLASLTSAFHEELDWADTAQRVDQFEQRVMALPSAKFDNAIYTDSPDAEDWTLGMLSRGRLGPEVSFQQFKFQPPLNMKLDLHSSLEDPAGLIWNGTTNPALRLSISTQPRNNLKQRKPAVSDKPAVIKSARDQGLLVVDGTNKAASEGRINDMTVTRIVDKTGEHLTQYYIPAGPKWIVVEVHPTLDALVGRVANAGVRTLREMEPGEKPADVFSPDTLIARLGEETEVVSALLRKAGPAGEDAVDALLKNPTPAREQALAWLKDNATRRSSMALRKAALDPNLTNAEAARSIMARLAAEAATQPSEPAPDAKP